MFLIQIHDCMGIGASGLLTKMALRAKWLMMETFAGTSSRSCSAETIAGACFRSTDPWSVFVLVGEDRKIASNFKRQTAVRMGFAVI
jgi:hypothetical protein